MLWQVSAPNIEPSLYVNKEHDIETNAAKVKISPSTLNTLHVYMNV